MSGAIKGVVAFAVAGTAVSLGLWLRASAEQRPRPADSSLAPPAGRPSETVAPVAPAAPTAHLRGRVVDGDGVGLLSARVDVALERGGALEPIGEVATDRSGRWVLATEALARLAPLERGMARIVARAASPGHHPGSVAARVPLAASELVALPVLTLARGAVVRGRVLDEGGEPASGAAVSLVRGPEDADVVLGEGRADAEGRYEIGVQAAGPAALVARCEVRGAATLSGIELVPGVDVHARDLALVVGEELAGVVLDPTGRAVAGLALSAWPADVRPTADTGARGGDARRPRARTDETGRFRLVGLAPGRWRVRFDGAAPEVQPPDELLAGERDARLVFAGRRLSLDVRDAEGRPVPGARVTYAELVPGEREDLVPRGVRTARAQGPSARASLFVVPDVELALRAEVPAGALAEERLTVGPGEHQPHRVLVLSEDVALGRLGLRVSAPDGRPVEDFLVRLASDRTRLAVPDRARLTPDAEGWLPPLSAGRYRVEVHFGADSRGFLFPARHPHPVEVFPDLPAFLEVGVEAGGRVRLELRVPPADGRGAGAAWLLDPNGELPSRRLAFFSDGAGGERPPRPFARAVPLGRPALSQTLVPPGRWMLRLRAPGRREARVPIEIVAERVTDVSLALEPR